ncbi:18666_t:CDS:2 [Gigaspora rosea]|nr:18666_t:CDS:2 [Gigaspora rosea]
MPILIWRMDGEPIIVLFTLRALCVVVPICKKQVNLVSFAIFSARQIYDKLGA